jgi:hypothetical protein
MLIDIALFTMLRNSSILNVQYFGMLLLRTLQNTKKCAHVGLRVASEFDFTSAFLV